MDENGLHPDCLSLFLARGPACCLLGNSFNGLRHIAPAITMSRCIIRCFNRETASCNVCLHDRPTGMLRASSQDKYDAVMAHSNAAKNQHWSCCAQHQPAFLQVTDEPQMELFSKENRLHIRRPIKHILESEMSNCENCYVRCSNL